MADRQARTFEDVPAQREKTPILMGITGASGGGKTYSALRIATGIVGVTGGEVFLVDTDNRRSLQYADHFKFRSVPFAPPHSSLGYVDAIRYCVRRGAGCIIVDSMSHEHEGIGGMLEYHEAEVERLSGGNDAKREQVKMLAWSKPKAARRALILEIQRLGVPAIFCFRAKEGVKPVRGANGRTEVVQQGFTPIAGDEFVFEMTLNALLMPGSKGVPTWLPEHPGEKKMTKLPAQFEFLEKITSPMDEKLGEGLAKWSLGGVEAPKRQEARQEPDSPPPSDMQDEREDGPGGPESGPDDGFPGDRSEETRAITPEARKVFAAAKVDRELAEDAERREAEAKRRTAEAAAEREAAALKAGQPEKPEPAENGFGDFVDVLAESDDWPQIVQGLRDLTASADWIGADYSRQMQARAAAYHRLKELTNAGKGLDFLTDAQAFRCYVEAEEEAAVLGLHWDAFKSGPVWKILPPATQETFATAVGRRISTLSLAGANASDFT